MPNEEMFSPTVKTNSIFCICNANKVVRKIDTFSRVWLLLAGILLAMICNMAKAVTVTGSPTSCTNNTSVGSLNWSNPGNAVSLNTTYANVQATGATGTQLTNYLQCSGYGFAIPSSATINGITVSIVRHISSTNNTSGQDNAVRVVNSAGTIGTTDRSTTTTYTTSDVTEAHGGATDLWGAAWTAADINNVNFGTAYSGNITKTSTSSNRTISVDYIQITIDYTVPFPCTAPSNTPGGVTLTCVCDTFGSTENLNSSMIFGGTWALSHGTSDSAGTNPYINAATGLLRLTENTNNNAKAATVPGIFPAAGNYISVEFMHYAYQGGNTGADGIAVTLSDYSIPAVPGGFGGSLGYAQRNDGSVPPGFAGGWVGVALDEYGNYQNPTEGRLNGLVTGSFIPQSVGVRGPGNATSGYRLMGGTTGNPGGYSISANSTTTTTAPGYMYQIIVDARNYATNTINISVNRDATTKDGSTYTSIFGPFNAYTEANYALGQGWIAKLVPDYWKISFTGSTGGSTNVHEIGSLRICAQTIYPPSGGTASGFSAIDEAYPAAAGSTAPAYPNFQTGDIYMKLKGTPFKLWVAALTSSALSTGYSAISNKYVQVKFVDNTDNACGPDSARTCNTTCTNKTAVETGATQIATFPSGSSTGAASPSPTFTLNSAYKNLIAVMKECTTSGCTAYTATTPACSADSFSVRPLSIASVASIDTPTGTGNAAINVGTSGTPIFKAGSGNFALTATTTGVSGSPSGYAGVMKINNAALLPNSPATVAGVVSGTFPSATSGTPVSTATGTAFTYSEVGGFILPGYDPATDTTSLRGIYDGVDSAHECTSTAQCDVLKAASWTGVDSISTKGDCVADSYSNSKNATGKYGCNFGLLPNPVAPNKWVFGRFVPDHYDTAVTITSGVPLPCPTGLTCPILYNGFVYSGPASGQPGQPFTLNVYARNGSGGTTLNYDSTIGLSKTVTLSAWSALGGATANSNGTLNNSIVAASAFTSGSTVLGTPATPSFTFTATPTAPTDIYLRAVDTDSITSLRGASSVEGGVKVVSGRVSITNAYGSELLPLNLTATLQYWGGASTGYMTSTTDNVNTVTSAKINRTSCQGKLLTGSSCNTLGSISSVASVPTTPPPYGVFSIKLAAPGSGNTGSEDITVNLGGWPVWLPSITGRATFGVYGGTNEFIYMREAY